MTDALLTAGLGVLAVLAGGPLTVVVFRVIDRHPAPRFPALHDDSIESAQYVLRGGAWIGALERLAIYFALVADWKEAIALVLALKGLGRYPELRAGTNPAVAERFIIGTFVSVLWACGCAAAQHLLSG